MINWGSLYKDAYSLERPETLKYIRYSIYKHGVIECRRNRRRGFIRWIYELLHLQKSQ